MRHLSDQKQVGHDDDEERRHEQRRQKGRAVGQADENFDAGVIEGRAHMQQAVDEMPGDADIPVLHAGDRGDAFGSNDEHGEQTRNVIMPKRRLW